VLKVRNLVASRAYKHALATLSSLTAHLNHGHGPSWVYSTSPTFTISSNPLLASFLPNLQGQGPIGTAARIIIKLHHQFRDALLSIGFDTSSRPVKGKKGRDVEEEMKSKAVKVLDLLEHAADLGSEKAKYMLAQLALVCIIICLNPCLYRLIARLSFHPRVIFHLPQKRLSVG
jgi:SEL1 protein